LIKLFIRKLVVINDESIIKALRVKGVTHVVAFTGINLLVDVVAQHLRQLFFRLKVIVDAKQSLVFL